MIAHLCRLVWNRRRTNLLLVGELILSFLVLTPLVAGWMLFAAEQLQPLGFEHEGAWSAMVMDRDWEERDLRPLIEPVWRELRALDEVQAVALLSNAPLRYYIDTWEGIAAVFSSDEGLDALGLRLLSGRWFEPADEARRDRLAGGFNDVAEFLERFSIYRLYLDLACAARRHSAASPGCEAKE